MSVPTASAAAANAVPDMTEPRPPKPVEGTPINLASCWCGGTLRIWKVQWLEGDVTILLDGKKVLERAVNPRWVYWSKCDDCGAVG